MVYIVGQFCMEPINFFWKKEAIVEGNPPQTVKLHFEPPQGVANEAIGHPTNHNLLNLVKFRVMLQGDCLKYSKAKSGDFCPVVDIESHKDDLHRVLQQVCFPIFHDHLPWTGNSLWRKVGVLILHSDS